MDIKQIVQASIFVYLLNYLVLISGYECPDGCKCDFQVINCDCGGGRWVGWPSFNPNTTEIYINKCYFGDLLDDSLGHLSLLRVLSIHDHNMKVIKKNTFSRNLNLEILRLPWGKLHTIENGSLVGLTRLKEISLFSNLNLPLSQLANMFTGLNSINILQFDFGHLSSFRSVDMTTLYGSYLTGLDHVKTQLISLERCSIEKMDMAAVKSFKHTKCISFANNLISKLPKSQVLIMYTLIANDDLHFLHLSNQLGFYKNIKESYSFQQQECEEALQHIVSCPRMTDDQVLEFGFNSLRLPRSLKTVIANYLPLLKTDLGPMAFYSNNLTKVSSMQGVRIDLRGPVVGLTCLRHVNIAGTQVIVTDSMTLAYLPSLNYLNMSSCQLGNQISSLETTVIRNMTSLHVLDLSKNSIDYIDLSYLYIHAPKLEYLYMSGNNLKRISSVFAFHLIYLDLQRNLLTSLNQKDQKNLETLEAKSSGVTVELKSNIFQCRCDFVTYNMIKWLQQTSISLVDQTEYTCADNDIGLTTVTLTDISVVGMWLKCNSAVIISVSVTLIVTILTSLLARCLYRRRFVIELNGLAMRVWMISRLRKLRSKITKSDDQQLLVRNLDDVMRHPEMDKRLDRTDPVRFVYLLYAEGTTDDEIANKIYDFIQKESDFHVLLHEKSFIYGVPFTQNVYYLLQGSEKCILLLTDEFFKDKNVLTTLEYSMIKGSNYHITVGVDPLPVKEMVTSTSIALKMILQENKHSMIEYPLSDEGRQTAYEKILLALCDTD